jgi:Amt family ammonium transporter
MGIDTGDTAFVLVGAALVMLMTPALGLFYGGMVRRRNVLGTIMQSIWILGFISVLWAVIGYSLAFGPDHRGIIGGLDWAFLRNVGLQPNPDYARTVPHQAFMIFQMMFAVITPALITGAFAERMRFHGVVVFVALWSLLVYCPIAHWVWGAGGWIKELGGLDFAGGAVVHISSGAAALAAALVVGKRRGLGTEVMSPHNLPTTVLGAGLLWFGWFGFNAASALGSGPLATSAFLATHLSAAAATLSWLAAEWIHRGKPTTLGAASGCIAGLATITPASGYVGPMAAILIGLVAGLACYGAVLVKWRIGYDDSLDVVGIHGVGGTLGILAVGLFASTAINSSGADGLLLLGGARLLGIQAAVVAVVIAYSFLLSLILLKVVDWVVGLRVTANDEETGLDLSQHSEAGYSW